MPSGDEYATALTGVLDEDSAAGAGDYLAAFVQSSIELLALRAPRERRLLESRGGTMVPILSER